jgi:hypothetical protein
MHLVLAVIVAATIAGPTRETATSSQAKPASNTRTETVAALKAAKFTFEKADDSSWWITFKGDTLPSVNVLVRALDDMVTIVATVREKPELSPQALRMLLRASYDANFSKLALDDGGNLVVLTELPKGFSTSAFTLAVNEVAALADEGAALIAAPETRPSETLPDVPAAKGAAQTFLRGGYELTYDPTKWRLKPSTEPGETEFQHTSGDAAVKVIAERIEVPLDTLRQVVVENARDMAPDVVVQTETKRKVNGLEVVLMRYGGTAKGVKFVFYNQMYSDTSGTIQLAAWTATNLFDEYHRDFLEFFAGLRKVR